MVVGIVDESQIAVKKLDEKVGTVGTSRVQRASSRPARAAAMARRINSAEALGGSRTTRARHANSTARRVVLGYSAAYVRRREITAGG